MIDQKLGSVRPVQQKIKLPSLYSAANKYYSAAGHHEQQNKKKTTSQIKFSAVTIKQQIKLVWQHSLCK